MGRPRPPVDPRGHQAPRTVRVLLLVAVLVGYGLIVAAVAPGGLQPQEAVALAACTIGVVVALVVQRRLR
jgi:hypothetical protein